ncbi:MULTISPECIES: (2Fe-2S) ferredoxin domain-containing protein [Prochlorococcus]|uniref:(2Fe-2S) ferredoxin domain-containing protein n=1 Tax=Prochlorococcus TaxID=1218 RepID=UPI0005338A93|nr:Ferredoxin [Prochlorococcus sp. MIT 0601]
MEISHHILLCASPSKALCCDPETGIKSWNRLKRVIRDLRLEEPNRKEGIVLRSKVDCLRVCKEGPIMLIWPDGIWYRRVNPDLIELIVKQHIIEGSPVKEFIFNQTLFKK